MVVITPGQEMKSIVIDGGMEFSRKPLVLTFTFSSCFWGMFHSAEYNSSNITVSKFIKLLMHTDIPISILRILMTSLSGSSFWLCSFAA